MAGRFRKVPPPPPGVGNETPPTLPSRPSRTNKQSVEKQHRPALPARPSASSASSVSSMPDNDDFQSYTALEDDCDLTYELPEPAEVAKHLEDQSCMAKRGVQETLNYDDEEDWVGEFGDDSVRKQVPRLVSVLPPSQRTKTGSMGSDEEDTTYSVAEGGAVEEIQDDYVFPIDSTFQPGSSQFGNSDRKKKTSAEEDRQARPPISLALIKERLQNSTRSSQLNHTSINRPKVPPKPPAEPWDKKVTPPATTPKNVMPTPTKKITPPSTSTQKVTPPAMSLMPNFLKKKALPDLPVPVNKRQDSLSDDNASGGSTSSDSVPHVPSKYKGASLVPPAYHVRNGPAKTKLPPVPATAAKSLPLPPQEDEPVDSLIYDDAVSQTQLQLDHYPWFHRGVDRKEGRRRLKVLAAENPSKDGLFLVRDSKQTKYTLMVFVNGKDINLSIRERPDDGKFAVGNPKADEVTFESLPKLIDYHKANDLTVFDSISQQNSSVKLSLSPAKH